VRPSPTAAGLTALTVAALALGLWTWSEARRQRAEIEAALTGEAALLAATLAPGLAAAADALREIDEALGAHLLDDARLLAELGRDADPEPTRLRRIAEDNELDTVAYFDSDGRVRRLVGEPLGSDIGDRIAPLLAGRFEEQILESDLAAGATHRAAAVAMPRGGAVLVRVHADSAYAFSRRLGIDNLLRRLVLSEGVLYLGYLEVPGPVAASATWDGGPLPPPLVGGLGELRGRLAFETAVPVEAPAGRSATLRVGLDGAALDRASRAAARRSALVGVVLAGFGLASAAFALVSRERGRERVAAAARLATAEEARRRGERLALAGTLAAGLAHEVRSPLNAISLAAQALERSPVDEDVRGSARLIRSEVARLDGVLRGFLELARPASGHREIVDLHEVCAEVVDLLAPEAAAAGLARPIVTGAASAEADREALRRAMINLVRNAVQASAAGGIVAIEIGVEPGGDVAVRVRDEGSGLAPEILEKAFEPFVTTRAEGTGLGLALVRRIAEEHGGSVRLANLARRGAEAVLRLPAGIRPVSQPAPAPIAGRPRGE
jgi:signal transduction histidine kinase